MTRADLGAAEWGQRGYDSSVLPVHWEQVVMEEKSPNVVLELRKVGDDVWPWLFEEDCWIVGGREQSRQQVAGVRALNLILSQSLTTVDGDAAAAVGPLELRSTHEMEVLDAPILIPGNRCH
jgi:hypothetical protein